MEPIEITDQHLRDNQARMRALVIQRLEQIWQACLPHVDGTLADEGGRVDPRMVKIALDVSDRLHRLYRLDAPAGEEKPEPAALEAKDRLAVVESLRALEERLRP